MSDPSATRDDLDPEEIEAQEAADLPNREAMSLIQPGMGLVGGNLFSGPDQSFVDPSQLQGAPSTDPSSLPTDGAGLPSPPPSTTA